MRTQHNSLSFTLD